MPGPIPMPTKHTIETREDVLDWLAFALDRRYPWHGLKEVWLWVDKPELQCFAIRLTSDRAYSWPDNGQKEHFLLCAIEAGSFRVQSTVDNSYPLPAPLPSPLTQRQYYTDRGLP